MDRKENAEEDNVMEEDEQPKVPRKKRKPFSECII
jgi:hypothetical protein